MTDSYITDRYKRAVTRLGIVNDNIGKLNGATFRHPAMAGADLNDIARHLDEVVRLIEQAQRNSLSEPLATIDPDLLWEAQALCADSDRDSEYVRGVAELVIRCTRDLNHNEHQGHVAALLVGDNID